MQFGKHRSMVRSMFAFENLNALRVPRWGIYSLSHAYDKAVGLDTCFHQLRLSMEHHVKDITVAPG